MQAVVPEQHRQAQCTNGNSPWAREIKVAELLRELHWLRDNTLLGVVITDLTMAKKWNQTCPLSDVNFATNNDT